LVGVALNVWFSYAKYMKMTRDERVFGFKSCDVSIYRWIWMLSFFLKHNWIGIDYFLLNFFATFASGLGLQITVAFGSVLGLQVTVGLQVNRGLQPPTLWEPFVAGSTLRRPEPAKERVQATILSIIAIEMRPGAEPDIFIWGATGGASFATRGAVNGLCRTFIKRPTPPLKG